MIEVNQIIKNLIPTEPVTIIKLQPLGTMYSIKYMQMYGRINEKVLAEQAKKAAEKEAAEKEAAKKRTSDKKKSSEK